MPFQTSQTSPPWAANVGKIVQRKAAAETFSGLLAAANVQTVRTSAVGTATDASTYTVRVRLQAPPGQPSEWHEASYLTTSTNAAAARDGLVAATNANPQIAGLVTAAAADSGTAIQWTDVQGGPSVVDIEIVANPGGALGAITVATAGADNAEATFGRYMREVGIASGIARRQTTIAPLAPLAGPVITLTATWASADTYSIVGTLISPEGVAVQVAEDGASGADLPAFLASIVADLDGIVPGATVSADSPDVVWSLPVGWSVAFLTVSATADSALTAVVTAGSAIPIASLVADDGQQAPATIGGQVTGYPGGRSALLVRSACDVSVLAPGTTPTYGGRVWIETAAGVNLGRPYAHPAPTRYPHPAHRWIGVDPQSPGLGLIGA